MDRAFFRYFPQDIPKAMRQCLLVTAMLFVVTLFGTPAFAQEDGIGPGRAIQFDGVDDYIDLGNIYDDIQFPLTISAWVYKNNSSQYILPVFVSQDNGPLYNGFWFCLSATNLFFEYGDGRGQQSDAYRKGKSAFIPNLANRWIYVSAVITSSNNVQLFANGYNVGGSIQDPPVCRCPPTTQPISQRSDIFTRILQPTGFMV